MNPIRPPVLMHICKVNEDQIKKYYLNNPVTPKATEEAFEAIRNTANFPPEPEDMAAKVSKQQKICIMEKAYEAFENGASLQREIIPLIDSYEYETIYDTVYKDDTVKFQLYICLAGHLAAWGADIDQILEVVNCIPLDLTLSYKKTSAKEVFDQLNIPYELHHRNARVDCLIEGIVLILSEDLSPEKPVPPMLDILINLLPSEVLKNRLTQEKDRLMQGFVAKKLEV